MRREWGGNIFFSQGDKNAKGVCILVKPKVKYDIKKILRDDQGRFICLIIEINGEMVTLCNIYPAKVDCPEFFNDTFAKIEGVEVEI